MMTYSNDREAGNDSGLMNGVKNADRPPASPANAAEIANTVSLALNTLTPADAAAVSLPATAWMPRPNRLLIRFRLMTSTTARQARARYA